MARLLVHVEGQTEETFVNELLRQYLTTRGFDSVSARLLGNARQRSERGGARSWDAVRKDIVRHLKQDLRCISTTMVDYYGLPRSGGKAWPGREKAGSLAIAEKAVAVEAAVLSDIFADMGGEFNSRRFVPFVVMHEFEALLFSDCVAFARGVGRPQIESRLKAIRDQFRTSEDIDDSPETAPSKRVEAVIAGYTKPLFRVLAALEIGLDKIREACPHFRCWLEKLQNLSREF
jgi:hypothetical protein